MKIFVLNQGSSSLKCCIYAFSQLPNRLEKPLWETKVEWKNVLSEKRSEQIEENLRALLSDKEIDCVGHRIVLGGKKYRESVFVDEEVKKEIQRLSDLAPLHNVADLKGIEVLEKLFPGKPQIAVFDTAFHHTLPPSAAVYPGPYEWTQMGIERFGFHGISFQYCVRKVEEMLGQMPRRMVICHLGSGASLCAIESGKSIDTTMGFTPLEGLMMDTRSGTIDPGILLYLLRKKGKSVELLSKELYEKSGLLGLSGISSDMRDILARATEGNPRAELAITVYIHRLTSLIGSMIASLNGIDVLVFTGGIGENAAFIRERVCERLSFLEIHLKPSQNTAEDSLLSTNHSKVKVLVIHTQEAFEIARECFKKMKKL